MKVLNDFLKELINSMDVGDDPVNVLVDGKLYDIKTLYYDPKICEFIMELEGGYEYER